MDEILLAEKGFSSRMKTYRIFRIYGQILSFGTSQWESFAATSPPDAPHNLDTGQMISQMRLASAWENLSEHLI